MGKEKTLVSACLLGIMCRYDGRKLRKPRLFDPDFIPVCPEQLGGLPTPRFRSMIQGGTGEDVLKGKARVLDEERQDVTEYFLRGAAEVRRIVKMYRIKKAYLKKWSPSCGEEGVLTALLKKMKIKLVFV